MNPVKLYDEILNLFDLQFPTKSVDNATILKISGYKKDDIESAVNHLVNNGYLNHVLLQGGYTLKYTLTQSGVSVVQNGGLTSPQFDITGIEVLKQKSTLMEDFENEIKLKKAEEADRALHYIVLRGGTIPRTDYSVHLNQYAFQKHWSPSLFSEYFLQEFGSDVRITERGMKFYNEGGARAIFYSTLNESNRQKELKRKQEETIEFNHYIAQRNKENYVEDTRKFWTSFAAVIIAGGALLFTAGNFYLNYTQKGKIDALDKRIQIIEKK